MSIEKMYAVIEAVLFTMGESVETAKLADKSPTPVHKSIY